MSNPEPLSDAETRTLLAYVKCGSIKLAAKERGVHVQTIKNQLFSARQKCRARNVTHLAALMFPTLGSFYVVEHKHGYEL